MKKKIIGIVLCLFSTIALAQHKQVHAIITATPGGGIDLSTRHFEKYLLDKKNINLSFVYKPGAESLIGLIELSKSAKDGTVIGFTSISGLAHAMDKNNNLDFDFVSATRKYAAVLVTNSKTNVQDFDDFVQKLKNGQDFKFGQSPAQKLQIDFLIANIKPKIQPVVVPYKGTGPILNDILGGHIDIAMLPYEVVKEHIASKKVKILATTSKLADISNGVLLSKVYPNFIDYGGYCLLMPKNSDKQQLEFWKQTLEEYLSDMKVKEEFAKESSEAYPPGDKFLKDLVREYQVKYIQYK